MEERTALFLSMMDDIPNSSLRRPSTQSRVAPERTALFLSMMDDSTAATTAVSTIDSIKKSHGTDGGSHYEFVVNRPIRRVYRSLKQRWQRCRSS